MRGQLLPIALRSEAPVLVPGETLLVAVQVHDDGRTEGGIVSVFPRRDGLRQLALHGDGVQAAELAAKTAGEVLLTSHRPPPAKASVWSGHPDSLIRYLNGPSYGLAMLLAQVSLHLQQPLPTDVVATGEILPDGTVSAVSAVWEKVDTIATCAPWIRRFLVPADGLTDDLLAHARASGIELVGVRTSGDALAAVFGNVYALLREHRGLTVGTLADLLLHETANLGSRPAFWRILVHLLEQDRDVWTAASELEQNKVAVIQGVAQRRLNLPAPILSETYLTVLRALPRERALTTLAHIVQATALDRAIAPDVLWSWLRELRLRPVQGLSHARLYRRFRQASESELRVFGAFARLSLASGEPEVALAMNRALFRVWCEVAPEQASYPLTQLIACYALLPELSPVAVERWVRAWVAAGGGPDASVDHVCHALERAAVLRSSPRTSQVAEVLRGGLAPTLRKASPRGVSRASQGGVHPLMELWRQSGDLGADDTRYEEVVAALPTDQAAWLRSSPYASLREKLAVFPWRVL